ncbi:MAG: TolC family protein [Clostridia bacterium]|nr:TolC family protein [Clostridia bacterium]
MWRKWVSLVLMLALCLSMAAPVWAEEETEGMAPAGNGEEPPVLELSLEEAIEMALANNLEVALSENAIAKAQVSLREAKSGADQLDSYLEYTGATLETLQAINVMPRAAEMNVTLAKLGADLTKKGLMMNVEKAYYDVLKAQADVANKEAALERAKEQLRLAEASVAAGVAAKSDAMGARVGVTAAEVKLTTAQNTLEGAMMSLAQVLGRDLSEKFVLTGGFEYEPAEELDLEAYLSELMETNLSVVGAKEGLAIAELQLEQVAKLYTPNVYAYQKAQYDRDEAKIKYNQAKTGLELSVRQSYLNLKTAEKAYILLEENVKFAEETARLAALRYEAGVTTRLEMEKAYDQLNETEAQRLGMLYNYNLAKAQLRYGIFVGGGGAAQGGAGF